MSPSSTTLDYNEDGTYSINLYLDDIAPIVSGVRPYIFLDHYDKNLKGLNNLTIHHEPRFMDAFTQLPNLEARILSLHEINQGLETLVILTIVIDVIPKDFFDLDLVNQRNKIANQSSFFHRSRDILPRYFPFLKSASLLKYMHRSSTSARRRNWHIIF